MKKLIFLISFLPLFVYGQDPGSDRKISLGIIISPDYGYRTLQPDATAMAQWNADRRDTLEVPRFSYSTGVNFSYRAHKRVTLEAGVLFSDKGEKTKDIDLTFTPIPGQDPDPNPPKEWRCVYHYYYIDIPVKVNFNILTGKTKLFLTAGVAPGFFLTQKNSVTIEYTDGTIEKNADFGDPGFRTVNLAVLGGLGCSYDVTDYLTLSIEPTYRRSVTSIIDAPIKGYLYSIGLNTGVYYRF